MAELLNCRICGCSHLDDVIDLGVQGLASVFPRHPHDEIPNAPLILTKCAECGLVQLKHTMPSQQMYQTMMYGYRSGLNATMMGHLEGIVKELVATVDLKPGDVVLDVGSNDATLLKAYDVAAPGISLDRVGIDPTGEQFRSYYPTEIKLEPDFFSARAYQKVMGATKKAKAVTSISMFYDLPNPQQFMNDVRDVLEENGVWVMEQSYMPTMLERQSFDTVCHEHLEYYCLSQIHFMAERAGLRILKVQFNDCNGGSFRVHLCHVNSTHTTSGNTEDVDAILAREQVFKTTAPYQEFMLRCETQKRRLLMLLTSLKAQGKSIYLYGASTKGNTLLQYYGITNDMITGAAERNPDKYGAMTPVTHIPIMSEDQVRAAKPDYMLVLPWHFKTEFLSRENAYLENGGQFIFPLPQIEIVSKKPIALITGVSGQIGQYLAPFLYDKGYAVYGTSRDFSHRTKNVTMVWGGVKDIIQTLKPAEMYHLAAETDSQQSISSPTQTIDTNATMVAEICDAVSTDTRLFIANSTELFKGIQVDRLNEDDICKYMHPRTPYGIGKMAAYWLGKYGRDVHNKYICSGILTNTESVLRRPSFVTRKIAEHVKLMGASQSTLKLGNMNVHRDWIHASDAASAMWCILQQPSADDYFISSGTPSSLRAFASAALNGARIQHSWITPETCVNMGGNIIIQGENSGNRLSGYEVNDGTTVFDNSKLKSIGWSMKYTMDDLAAEMVHIIETTSYVTCGRVGDIFHVLAVLQARWQQDGKKAVLYISDDIGAFGGDGYTLGLDKAYADLKPLLESQVYVHEVLLHRAGMPHGPDWVNLNQWRNNLGVDWTSLLRKTFQTESSRPWLRVDANKYRNQLKNKVIIHRGTNRHNAEFPWECIVRQNDCVYVTCNPNEFSCFQFKDFVQCIIAADLEDMAAIISAGKGFIGSMSSPAALAWALGGPMLVETYGPDEHSYACTDICWYGSPERNHLAGIQQWLNWGDQQQVTLTVSVGEGLDKLSILHIKKQNITDAFKLKMVQNEIDAIEPALAPFLQIPQVSKQYQNLVYVNQRIWHMVDKSRELQGTDIEVMAENDARFRVKNKINMLLNSSIKEQKNVEATQYVVTVATSKELADEIPAIHKAAIYHDTVIVYADEAILAETNDAFRECVDIMIRVLD
jgi:GDP-mannose 4,6-dehydratase